jgi:hypothetical protein
MATLMEKIALLETKLVKLEQEREVATTEAMKMSLDGRISSATTLLSTYVAQLGSVAEVSIDWDLIRKSVVSFRNSGELTLKSGQGVAVSPRLILTALHGMDVGTEFEMTSLSGEVSSGVAVIVSYEENKVDIALIRLKEGQHLFQHWLRVATRRIEIQEQVSVVSLQPGLAGGIGFASQPTTIFMFDPNTALCRAQYYTMDGLSGSGVVAASNPADGSVVVVGVHVAASHDTPCPINGTKGETADTDTLSQNSDSSANAIHHGSMSYSTICVANMVPEIMDAITQDSSTA